MIHAWNKSLWTSLHSGSGTPTGSLLLAGPQGVGKRAFALALAQGLLCANLQTGGEPCGACMSCRLFAADSHPDFRRLEPALDEGRQTAEEGSTGSTAPPVREGASILVGQVRALTDFLVIASQLAGRKVVLIQPADRLHPSAANALLKTLEEPLAGTVFILVADHPQRLVPTIRSRCFRVDFSLPPREVALKWLAEEGVEQPEVALAQAGFAPLKAVTLDRSGFPSRRRSLSEILVSAEDPAQLAGAVDPGEVSLVCHLLQRWCYDLLSLRLADQVRYNPDYAAKLRGLADKVDVHQLRTLIKELDDAARALEHPLNPRLVIEHLAIRYTRMISRQPS